MDIQNDIPKTKTPNTLQNLDKIDISKHHNFRIKQLENSSNHRSIRSAKSQLRFAVIRSPKPVNDGAPHLLASGFDLPDRPNLKYFEFRRKWKYENCSMLALPVPHADRLRTQHSNCVMVRMREKHHPDG